MKSKEKIEKILAFIQESMGYSSKDDSLSYGQGFEAALLWVLEELDDITVEDKF